MNVGKVFEAASVEEAFRKVREELGPDALIYETRRRRAPGLLGIMGRSVVQVVAGADDAGPAGAPGYKSREARAISELLAEVLSLKQAVDRLTLQPSFEEAALLSKPLRQVYRVLLAHRYPEPLARQLVLRVRDELSPYEARQDARVRRLAAEYLGGSIPAPKRLDLSAKRVVFVTGPTGSGKTTTVLKLAVGLTLQGKKASVINADVHRPGATAQLRALTDIVGIPCETAYSPSELAQLVGRYRGRATVIVDTPGRNPRSSDQLAELRTLLEAVGEKVVLLTVQATSQTEEMAVCVDAFSLVPIYGLVITKLDEAGALGPLLSFLQEKGQPASFLGTGPKIPDDLQPADIETLIGRILDLGSDG
jgi:flagellar biosynthesis protein FlhF